jgi:hypothetical protein
MINQNPLAASSSYTRRYQTEYRNPAVTLKTAINTYSVIVRGRFIISNPKSAVNRAGYSPVWHLSCSLNRFFTRGLRVKGIVIALVMLSCASAIWSQDIPRAEVFGGYSYLNADTNNLAKPSRQSANGWDVSAAGNLNRWFAVEGDFSGYYKTYPVDTAAFGFDLGIINLKVHDYGFVGGPRFNFRPLFFHALVGVDHLTGSVNIPSVGSGSASQDGFAGIFGGGIEWKVSSRWGIRGSADYVLTRHNILNLIPGVSGSVLTQNNFRASAGVVFFLGGIAERTSHEKSPHPSGHEPSAPTLREAVSEAPC